MPSNLLILCRPLLLPPSIFPSIRVFSNESVLHIRWPKYWSFSFSISPSNEYSGLISFRMDWFDLLAVQGTLKSPFQQHSSKASILSCSAFFIVQLYRLYCCFFGSCNQVAFPGDNNGACIVYFWLSMPCSSALCVYEWAIWVKIFLFCNSYWRAISNKIAI